MTRSLANKCGQNQPRQRGWPKYKKRPKSASLRLSPKLERRWPKSAWPWPNKVVAKQGRGQTRSWPNKARIVEHRCGMQGVRVGEASNPGPPRRFEGGRWFRGSTQAKQMQQFWTVIVKSWTRFWMGCKGPRAMDARRSRRRARSESESEGPLVHRNRFSVLSSDWDDAPVARLGIQSPEGGTTVPASSGAVAEYLCGFRDPTVTVTEEPVHREFDWDTESVGTQHSRQPASLKRRKYGRIEHFHVSACHTRLRPGLAAQTGLFVSGPPIAGEAASTHVLLGIIRPATTHTALFGRFVFEGETAARMLFCRQLQHKHERALQKPPNRAAVEAPRALTEIMNFNFLEVSLVGRKSPTTGTRHFQARHPATMATEASSRMKEDFKAAPLDRLPDSAKASLRSQGGPGAGLYLHHVPHLLGDMF